MAVLGERAGGDPSVIAAAQALRVVAVVTIVPLALQAAGARGGEAWAPGAHGAVGEAVGAGLARVVVWSGAAGLLAHAARLPNAWLLGPLAGSAALAAGHLGASAIPSALVDAAQVLMGCALGSRFERSSFRGAGALAWAILLATAQSLALLASFAAVLAAASGRSAWTLLLATAPGGVAEMCLTARTLRLDVPLVTAFHVSRMVVLLTLAPLAFRLWRRAAAPGGAAGAGPTGP